jgi:hypothetical protein
MQVNIELSGSFVSKEPTYRLAIVERDTRYMQVDVRLLDELGFTPVAIFLDMKTA